VLGSYPLLLGIVIPWLMTRNWGVETSANQVPLAVQPQTILPEGIAGLLQMSAENLLLFGLIWGVAWALRRLQRDELFARWPGLWQPWVFGVAHSISLRLLAAGVTVAVAGGLFVIFKLTGKDPHALENLRPRIENVIATDALRDPIYLLLTTTLVSFVVAGLREELWRAGVLRYLFDLLPDRGKTWRGQTFAVFVSALIFGLGHWPQGPAGMLLTFSIGLGLGAILLFHRSLWIAVLAHGFFDATTFILLRLLDHFGLLQQLLPK
jgi:membrane protease YdiL (CAAX protease family)